MSIMYNIFNIPFNKEEMYDKASKDDKKIKLWRDKSTKHVLDSRDYIEFSANMTLDEIKDFPKVKTYTKKVYLPDETCTEDMLICEKVHFRKQALLTEKERVKSMLSIVDECDELDIDCDIPPFDLKSFSKLLEFYDRKIDYLDDKISDSKCKDVLKFLKARDDVYRKRDE